MRNYFYHIKLCLFIIAGLLAVSHAAAGNNNDDNSQEPFYTANKAVLEKMNTGQPITVIGHKNQDPDAVCAAISFAALLRELNINATPYLQGRPIQAVRFVLDYIGYPAPEVKTTIESDMPLVLVDHNDTLQSISNVSQANIVGIVDHHAVSTSIATNGPLYCSFNPVGSTNTIVYSIFQQCNITPSRTIAGIMLAGIIADTDSLTKGTTTVADHLAVTELNKIAKLNLSELNRGIMAALESYDGMTDEEIFLSDSKLYQEGDYRYIVANINASKSFPLDKACRLVRNIMPTKLGTDGATMIFANIADRESQTTHIPYCGKEAKEVAEAAFGTTNHDNCITVPRLLTRKSDFVPAITKVLRNQ